MGESYKDIFKTDEFQGKKKEERTIKDRKREVKYQRRQFKEEKWGAQRKYYKIGPKSPNDYRTSTFEQCKICG